ncbi:MAG: hypothetical protein ACOYD0_08535 [Candidatus Nanopelagicales bacterium]
MSAERTTDTALPSEEPSAGTSNRQYGISVLLTGLAHLVRHPLGFIIVILINAIVQMLLIMWTPVTSDSLAFWASSTISLVSLLICYSWICHLALATVDGTIGLRELFSTTTKGLGLFLGWVILELIAVFVLASLWFWPGLIAMLLMPFVAIAATDGKRNAVKVNFVAIKQRLGRYLVTVIFWIIIIAVAWLLVILGSITLPTFALGLFGWLFKGLIGAWLTCSFAVLYRSTAVGAAASDS